VDIKPENHTSVMHYNEFEFTISVNWLVIFFLHSSSLWYRWFYVFAICVWLLSEQGYWSQRYRPNFEFP